MSTSRPRLLLIDGHALLYRSFYAFIGRPLRSASGENTSATWGVAHALCRYVVQEPFDAIAWTMDAGDSGRLAIYPEYKATREKLEAELRAEFEQSIRRTEELLEAFGVTHVAIPGWEADDVIGTLTARAEAAGWDVVILSGDKDFHQLVTPHVSLLNPGRGGPAAVAEALVTMDNAHERLGVPPHQVVDYLALLGDSSDNVPGVKGIGEKSATRLLAEFGSLDAILENAASLPGKRERTALTTDRERALLSRTLVTIRRDAPVDLAPEALAPRGINRPALRRVLESCDFATLVTRWQLGESGAAAGSPVPAGVSGSTIAPDPADAAALADDQTELPF